MFENQLNCLKLDLLFVFAASLHLNHEIGTHFLTTRDFSSSLIITALISNILAPDIYYLLPHPESLKHRCGIIADLTTSVQSVQSYCTLLRLWDSSKDSKKSSQWIPPRPPQPPTPYLFYTTSPPPTHSIPPPSTQTPKGFALLVQNLQQCRVMGSKQKCFLQISGIWEESAANGATLSIFALSPLSNPPGLLQTLEQGLRAVGEIRARLAVRETRSQVAVDSLITSGKD